MQPFGALMVAIGILLLIICVVSLMSAGNISDAVSCGTGGIMCISIGSLLYGVAARLEDMEKRQADIARILENIADNTAKKTTAESDTRTDEQISETTPYL